MTTPIINERRIFIRDLACQATLGVHAHEKRAPQQIYIDIDLFMEDGDHGDQLSQTICYEKIAEHARALALSRHFNLVESLAAAIASACLEARAIRVRVCVRKPEALAHAREAGVEITRVRP